LQVEKVTREVARITRLSLPGDLVQFFLINHLHDKGIPLLSGTSAGCDGRMPLTHGARDPDIANSMK
jgi:hypothetical protein